MNVMSPMTECNGDWNAMDICKASIPPRGECPCCGVAIPLVPPFDLTSALKDLANVGWQFMSSLVIINSLDQPSEDETFSHHKEVDDGIERAVEIIKEQSLHRRVDVFAKRKGRGQHQQNRSDRGCESAVQHNAPN